MGDTGALELARITLHLFRLKDGRIVELWGREDVFGLMQQLGAIPAAA